MHPAGGLDFSRWISVATPPVTAQDNSKHLTGPEQHGQVYGDLK